MIRLDLTKKYALAVSGGVDSMVMLHLFANSDPIPDFSVVTVDHGIRPEAQSDCDFVASRCAELGVECKIFHIDVPSFAAERKLSVETAARIMRYEILDGLQADAVCLAHNADDNAETVLMHILRGSGAKGATGIRRQNGKYLRPIIDWTRQDILRYARDNGVTFVEDSTNSDTSYTRNFIRHKVMPLLEEQIPSAKRNILRFAQNIASDDDYLDLLADIDSVEFCGDTACIPCELLDQPMPVAYRVIGKTFRRLGVFYDIEKSHLEAIAQLASNVGGKKVYLPFGYVAYNDYRFVTLCPYRQREQFLFEIPFAAGRTDTPMGVVEVSSEPLPDSLRIAADKIPDGAVFRTRRTGDVFTKFGGGAKPLRKYLIDRKIPERDRDSLLLLACGNEVLAILGVEISDKLRVEGDGSYIRLLSGAGERGGRGM